MNAKVISNDKIGESLYRMKLDAGKKISAKPGQFINVLVSESYMPLLRRPFSIFDASGRTLEIVYRALGDATRILSEKKQGDKLDFLGPLGGSYLDKSQVPDHKSQIVIVGGGTGAASTYFLAKVLKKKKIKFTLIQGARNKAQIVAPVEFKKLGCVFTTDDGSMGRKGFVTDALEQMFVQSPGSRVQGKTKHAPRSTLHVTQEKNLAVFACGPKPMLKAIKALAETKNNMRVFASLEEYMGCGIGACLSCVVEVKKGDYTEYKRVCKDGTVFNLGDVVF